MRVLFLDDDPGRHACLKRLSVGHEVTAVVTAAEAIAALRENEYDLVCLDHDLGGKVFVNSTDEDTGYQVAKSLSRPGARIPRRVIVHSFNPDGTARMVRRLRAAGVDVVAAPFGTWHLLGDGVVFQ
jgi:CheY-like chemotaxis protein